MELGPEQGESLQLVGGSGRGASWSLLLNLLPGIAEGSGSAGY
jgi:predicted ABC-type transport system involved in lysophospholipase L1 biosynthesis ATPase subunit